MVRRRAPRDLTTAPPLPIQPEHRPCAQAEIPDAGCAVVLGAHVAQVLTVAALLATVALFWRSVKPYAHEFVPEVWGLQLALTSVAVAVAAAPHHGLAHAFFSGARESFALRMVSGAYVPGERRAGPAAAPRAGGAPSPRARRPAPPTPPLGGTPAATPLPPPPPSRRPPWPPPQPCVSGS